MIDTIFGYIIINKDETFTWGKTYVSKGGAKKSYNDHFNSHYREDRHSFDEQDEWVIRPLVLGYE